MRLEVELRNAARQDRRRCGRRLDLEVEERHTSRERRRRSKTSVEDLRESVAKLTSVEKSWKRVMGPNHPELPRLQNVLRRAHVELAARAPES